MDVVGIDEAGRGPLAGPLAVAGVRVPASFHDWPLEGSFRDSKKLTPRMREVVFAWIQEKRIAHSVILIPASTIDQAGIVAALRQGVEAVLTELLPQQKEAKVLLDGNLHAPEPYSAQTIVKGDEKELAIALASVVAKVTRDRYMEALAKRLPQYGFEKHKGYGTKAHRAAIQSFGLSSEHRKSFCSNITTREALER